MLREFYKDSSVVVTGAAGTVGRELVRQLLTLPVREVRALDNDESGLFFLEQEYRSDVRLQAFLCDIRDFSQLDQMFSEMDLVFHAAALKHVPLCERSPSEAVRTNILGVENVIRAAKSAGIKRVLFTSSDKAVNPTNVMGTSKLMGERLITAANALATPLSKPIFSSTRFGNVAGSAGSVIPLFCRQIVNGTPITLTDKNMTRFLMTLNDSVKLVLSSMLLAKGGEVFVTKMPVVKIEELANSLVDLVAPAFGRNAKEVLVEVIGSRPGEKMYEELVSDEEVRRTFEIGDLFTVLPAFRNIYDNIKFEYSGYSPKPIGRVYNSDSETVMSKLEIEEFLKRPGVLPVEVFEKLIKNHQDNQ